MKAFLVSLALATALAFSFAPGIVRAQDDDSSDDQGVSFQNFYDQRGDQGTWVQTDDYGYVFQPNVSDPDWAPYSDGHWVYTDVGWTWVSDEPWGWATYHYGRWANIDGMGWVWVPGYRWAPAWVSWRYGGGYAGWAPLPPETLVGAEYAESGVQVGIGFHFGGDVDVNFNIGPGCYNFVRVGDLGDPNYRGHFVDRSNNYVVINKTTNITNINVNRGNSGGGAGNFRGVTANGPSLTTVNAHSRTHVQTVTLTAANQPGQSAQNGNSLSVYAPKVNPASNGQAKPSRVSQTLSNPTVNRGDSITKPLQVTSAIKPPAPTPAAIQAAQTAQQHASAKSKIATQKTQPKTTLTKPLTSLKPVTPTQKTTPSQANKSNETAKPNTESANTGEPQKPTTTSQSENEIKQPSEKTSPTTYHPQTESKPQESEEKPPTTPTYHPQTESKPQESEEKPPTTPTYHPQTESKPQESENKAPTTYHSPSQGGGGGSTHTAAPPASHPAASGGQGNKSGGDAKKAADEKKPAGQ
jgi:hypothetical protein